MDRQKEQLIEALVEKPSKYDIEVLDNSMLPVKIKVTFFLFHFGKVRLRRRDFFGRCNLRNCLGCFTT